MVTIVIHVAKIVQCIALCLVFVDRFCVKSLNIDDLLLIVDKMYQNKILDTGKPYIMDDKRKNPITSSSITEISYISQTVTML